MLAAQPICMFPRIRSILLQHLSHGLPPYQSDSSERFMAGQALFLFLQEILLHQCHRNIQVCSIPIDVQ